MKVNLSKVLMMNLVVLGSPYVWARTQYFVKKIYGPDVCQESRGQPVSRPKVVVEPYITVWVHGIGVYLWGGNNYNLGLKNVSGFTRGKSIDDIGKTIVASDPDRFPAERVYIFSWSGMSGFSERDKASMSLYKELKKLVEQYRKTHGIKPKIRILAFSHGGNVSLNLANIKDPDKLVIDELVLIGTPAQKKSSALIRDPMFKHVFNLYSTLDWVQIIDPQGVGEGCCLSPLFTNQRYADIDKMIQAKVRLNGHGIVHITFNSPRFLSLLPEVLDQLNEWLVQAQASDTKSIRTRYVLSLYTHARPQCDFKK